MKKILALIIAVVMLTSLCSFAYAADDPIVIQVGYENHQGEPIDQGCRKWAELLEEYSGGTMKIEVFPSSQLGTKTELIDQMLAGATVVTLADGAFFADYGVPDFGITMGPYLFETWEEDFTFCDSDIYARLVDELAAKGLQILAGKWIYGDRNVMATRPVESVADMKGLKIRVPSNNLQVEGMAIFGANPTPMALGDVYTALQQGTIDASEQPTAVLEAGGYAEVSKYLTITEHVKTNATWVCGTAFFNTLTPEQQEWLKKSGEEAGFYQNDIYFEQTEVALNKMVEEDGVVVCDFDKEEFIEASKPFYELEQFTSIWSENLYDDIMTVIGR